MFFDGWPGLLRVLVVGTAAYLSLIVILRSSGKRTLAKLSAFDLVVTVALGSTLATVLLSGDVALVEGVLAMVLLAVLQLVVTFASVRPITLDTGLEDRGASCTGGGVSRPDRGGSSADVGLRATAL